MRRLLGLIAAAWLIAAPATGAVTVNANATANAHTSSATALNLTSLTIASGSNTVLVVQLSFSVKTVTSVTVTWDNGGTNQAATLIKTANGSGSLSRAELWGLVAPVTGNKTLRITWTTTSELYLNATAFDGVDQTGGVTTFPNSTSTTNTGTTASLVITSAVNNITIDTLTVAEIISNPTQTQLWLDNSGTNVGGGASRGVGAATVTHAWTIASSSIAWVIVGCDIAAVTVTTLPKLTLLGVGL